MKGWCSRNSVLVRKSVSFWSEFVSGFRSEFMSGLCRRGSGWLGGPTERNGCTCAYIYISILQKHVASRGCGAGAKR